MKTNEIRIRYTDNGAYYVLGEQCRYELLHIINILKSQPIPQNWNSYDEDALNTMGNVLADERDFNDKQWSKVGKMIVKFNLPDSLIEIAEQANWVIGEPLTKSEMFDIMESRREVKRQAKLNIENNKFTSNRSATYNNLFK